MAAGTCRLTLGDWKFPGGIAGRPACPGCSETMRAVDETDSNGGTWFRHIADTDCPLVDNGRQLLESFCQERNLLECYNVLCRILQLQFLDPEEFYGICKGAHFRRIWSLSALDRQNLPYVLALTKDVTAYETDGEGRKIPTHTQRFVMHSDRMIHIWLLGNDGFPIWSSRKEVALLNPEIEGQRSDIDWILEQPALVAELGRFCREKGFCGERDQAGAQLPSPGSPEDSTMQYAIVQDRILAAEEYVSLMTHRTGIIQLEIPDTGMSLKLVYGSLKPQPDSSAEDVMAETLRTLGTRYGTIADRECIPSELVDIEFGEPLIRGKAVDVPFAALLRTAMEIGAKRKTSTPLFVLYGDMNPAESLFNRPGVLCVYRQENRPRAEITEFGWRDAFRPERPLQCARNCL